MLSSVMSPTAKTTVSLYLELLLAIQSHSKVLRSPSDRYFQFVHHPLLSHTNASFSTLACHVQHLVQLGVFRKTAIPGQFCLEWLQSSYRNFQWGYSVDFLRIEGYEHGKLCFWIFGLAHLFVKLFFHSRKEKKYFWHNSQAVCVTHPQLLVLADVESSNVHASWSGCSSTGVVTQPFLHPNFFPDFFFIWALSSLQRHWEETHKNQIRTKLLFPGLILNQMMKKIAPMTQPLNKWLRPLQQQLRLLMSPLKKCLTTLKQQLRLLTQPLKKLSFLHFWAIQKHQFLKLS